MLAVDRCWKKVKKANKSKNRRDCRREWNIHHERNIKLQNVGVDNGDGRETSALSAKPYEYISWCSLNVVSITSGRGCRHILSAFDTPYKHESLLHSPASISVFVQWYVSRRRRQTGGKIPLLQIKSTRCSLILRISRKLGHSISIEWDSACF